MIFAILCKHHHAQLRTWVRKRRGSQLTGSQTSRFANVAVCNWRVPKRLGAWKLTHWLCINDTKDSIPLAEKRYEQTIDKCHTTLYNQRDRETGKGIIENRISWGINRRKSSCDCHFPFLIDHFYTTQEEIKIRRRGKVGGPVTPPLSLFIFFWYLKQKI